VFDFRSLPTDGNSTAGPIVKFSDTLAGPRRPADASGDQPP
jgi:hypothetical protein